MGKRMKYNLVGIDGNAYSIMGYVRKAMKAEGKTAEEMKAYTDDATSGEYNHLLAVSMEMIDELNNKVIESKNKKEVM